MKRMLTSTEINSTLKTRIVKCYVYSTLLYGTETLTHELEDWSCLTNFVKHRTLV